MTGTAASDDALFDDCVRSIDDEYRRLGHGLGWRFLYGPRAVLHGPVEIALVTLNPGGRSEPGDHPPASCESGVAFVAERWAEAAAGRSRLQVQIRRLFGMLAEHRRRGESCESLMARSALASLVPFRSVRFATLHRREDSIAFGHSLWTRLLPRWQPRLIVGLGREVQAAFRTLIPATLDVRATSRSQHETGWGAIRAEIDEYRGDGRVVRFLYLPHLSRYGLFTSVRCEAPVDRLIGSVVAGL